MAATYEPIATNTLSSTTSSVTFSSIASTYTDLILVLSVACNTNDQSITFRLNSDTATNYSTTNLLGNGSAASSRRTTSQTSGYVARDTSPTTTVGEFNAICQIQNYANTTTYKTVLCRANGAVSQTYTGAEASVSLWRKTPETITSITLSVGGTFSIGSTFTLYGIKAA